MRSPTYKAGGAGFTLIELVITIIVLAIGILGILRASTYTTARSADPVIIHQANAIAEAYLEEIMLQPFCDPDASTDCVAACSGGGPACSNSPACTISEGGNRSLYDDVCDYNNLPDTVVRNRAGNPVANLSNYSVTVQIIDDGSASLGTGGNVLSGSGGDLLQIDVSVDHAVLDAPVDLSGYKANY